MTQQGGKPLSFIIAASKDNFSKVDLQYPQPTGEDERFTQQFLKEKSQLIIFHSFNQLLVFYSNELYQQSLKTRIIQFFILVGVFLGW